MGDAVFERFTGLKAGTLWYYRALVEVYQTAMGAAGLAMLVDELAQTVAALERQSESRLPGERP